MKVILSLISAIAISTSGSWASKIPNGSYKQVSISPSDWGECPKCLIKISNETPHIIKIVSNNDWVGYATYDDKKDEYHGVWEWKKGHGGYYAGEIFESVIKFDGNNLVYKVKSNKTGKKHTITYKVVQ